MAVNHRKDSIQLIRDTEGINNKDRVRILSPGSSPPEETTEVTEHALYMEPKNTPGDGEPYEYEFACCTGRRFIPQRAGDANKLEGKTSAEVKAMFADGRAVFAGSGKSVALDAEGDRVHSITVNGFTKQEGSGDASPKNVRHIVNGGLKMVEMILKGTEEILYTKSTSGKGRFRITTPSIVKTIPTASGTSGYVYCTDFKEVSRSQTDYGTIGISAQAPNMPGVYIYDGRFILEGNATNFKAWIAARYAAGNPVIVWYVPADEADSTGIYTPLTGTGDGHTGACGELIVPLCQGDKLITKVKSGCDKKIILDGQSNKIIVGSGATYGYVNITDQDGYDPSVNPISSYVPHATTISTTGVVSFTAYQQSSGYGFNLRLPTESNSEAYNAYLQKRPLTVYMRSTAYTEATDIPVSLETHQKAVLVLDGTENITTNDGWTSGAVVIYNALIGAVDTPGYVSIADILCSHLTKNTPGAIANGTIGVGQGGGTSLYMYFGADYASVDAVKAYIAAQYAAGTPVTIVYELATPLVYAHEPVDFEFSPGEDGVFTITGEADGTLDVYYKALQDGGDADKLGGKLPEYYAAAANALGQYTHTKSGTVHELTGTGDNIRFVATADFAAGDTVKVNGTTCTASTMSGDALWAGFFKSGAVVVCYRTGNALNFSGGGLAAAEAAKITPENLKTGVSVTVNGKTVAGTFTADGTAAAGDMLEGKTGYVNGQKVTGSMPNRGAVSQALAINGTYTIPAGYHNGSGKVTQSIPTKAAASYKPGTAVQTIKAGQYLSGDQTIQGDAALIAANIKYGAAIFGVAGGFTSDGTAAGRDMRSGTVAYVKGQRVVGSLTDLGYEPEGTGCAMYNSRLYSYFGDSSSPYIISRGVNIPQEKVAATIGLTADKIAVGQNILGVAGSFVEGSGGYLHMGQRNNTAMTGYAFGSASYSNGIRIGRSGNYRLVLFGYNETGDTGYLRVNGADVLSANLGAAAKQQTVKWLNAGDVVTIAASGGVNYALTGFVYNT